MNAGQDRGRRTSATYNRAAHCIAADSAQSEYFAQRIGGGPHDHAAAVALEVYLNEYERAAGKPFPEELLDSGEWPGIWDEPRPQAKRRPRPPRNEQMGLDKLEGYE